MALQSVANEERRDAFHWEQHPYERIDSKLDGIRAVAVLANVALEHDAITDKVWHPLWHFIGEVCDDIKADANALRKERRGSP